MKERHPGKYILFLLLFSTIFYELGVIVAYYTPSEEGCHLPVARNLKDVFAFTIAAAPHLFTNNTFACIGIFYSAFLWPYNFALNLLQFALTFKVTWYHYAISYDVVKFEILGEQTSLRVILGYNYFINRIPIEIKIEGHESLQGIWTIVQHSISVLSPAIAHPFNYAVNVYSRALFCLSDKEERFIALFGSMPHGPFEDSAFIFIVVSSHLITYAGFRTIYFSLKTLLRRMSLSDLKREVKRRYLLALRESKYLISWAILLLVIAALLEGFALTVYNPLKAQYYPWTVVLYHSVYVSIFLWIIYLYHKRMRFSTPWKEMRKILKRGS